MFFDSKLAVPGLWFESSNPFEMMTYEELSEVERRTIRNSTIGVSTCFLPDIDKEKEVFELINFGGIPQGENDV